MSDIEDSITKHLHDEADTNFNLSDEELIKRAIATANQNQGVKDITTLGIVCIWVVFINIFLIFFKPSLHKKNTKENLK